MLIETSLLIGVFVCGYIVGRLRTQSKIDRALLRRGIK